MQVHVQPPHVTAVPGTPTTVSVVIVNDTDTARSVQLRVVGLEPGWIEHTAADLTVRLLGPIEVYRDAQRKIPTQTRTNRRAIQVFCCLAVAPDHRATRDRLADALWVDVRPSVVERNFHPTIACLCRILNHGHNVPRNFIQCERGAYLLNPAYRYDIDLETFEERVRSARSKASRRDAAGALADYEASFALYRGPLMEEEYGKPPPYGIMPVSERIVSMSRGPVMS